MRKNKFLTGFVFILLCSGIMTVSAEENDYIFNKETGDMHHMRKMMQFRHQEMTHMAKPDFTIPGMPFMPFMHHGPMMMAGNPLMLVKMSEKLNLNPEQRKKIGKIMDDTMPKMRDLMFAMVDSNKELQALLKGEELNKKEIRAITKNHGEIIAEMMFLRLRSQADIQSALDPEQREKFRKLMQHDHAMPASFAFKLH